MKRKRVALLQAIGSVIALSPAVVSANGMPANPVAALRQDAAAIRGDFQRAMVRMLRLSEAISKEQSMPDQKESENTKLTCEEQKDNELVSRVIENPEVLNRVLESPQVRAIVCQHFQGPVPPPSMLKKYDQLMPGLANRLVECMIN